MAEIDVAKRRKACIVSALGVTLAHTDNYAMAPGMWKNT